MKLSFKTNFEFNTYTVTCYIVVIVFRHVVDDVLLCFVSRTVCITYLKSTDNILISHSEYRINHQKLIKE